MIGAGGNQLGRFRSLECRFLFAFDFFATLIAITLKISGDRRMTRMEFEIHLFFCNSFVSMEKGSSSPHVSWQIQENNRLIWKQNAKLNTMKNSTFGCDRLTYFALLMLNIWGNNADCMRNQRKDNRNKLVKSRNHNCRQCNSTWNGHHRPKCNKSCNLGSWNHREFNNQ